MSWSDADGTMTGSFIGSNTYIEVALPHRILLLRHLFALHFEASDLEDHEWVDRPEQAVHFHQVFSLAITKSATLAKVILS